MNPIIRIEKSQGKSIQEVLMDLLVNQAHSYRSAAAILHVSPTSLKRWADSYGITQHPTSYYVTATTSRSFIPYPVNAAGNAGDTGEEGKDLDELEDLRESL